MNGSIHSIDTMGLHDGPGMRFTVFMQGCPLRCVYCHNPDTWLISEGTTLTPEALLQKALRYTPWFKRSGGGVTVTGGEPLMQSSFVTAFFKLCKENGLHTTLDTSGVGVGDFDELLTYTDLVLLDLKSATPTEFKAITGVKHTAVLPFHHALQKSQVDIWIRHVVVPGLNDTPKQQNAIKDLAATFPSVQQIDWLPYHDLGVHKYEAMGIPYKL